MNTNHRYLNQRVESGCARKSILLDCAELDFSLAGLGVWTTECVWINQSDNKFIFRAAQYTSQSTHWGHLVASKRSVLIASVMVILVIAINDVLAPAHAQPQCDYPVKVTNETDTSLKAVFARYYKGINNQSGAQLKSALNKLISESHDRKLTYTKSNNDDWCDLKNIDVWEALAYTDSDCPVDCSECCKIRLLYLDETRDLVQAYKGGKSGCLDFWEREHVWPTSRGNFANSKNYGYTDLHHIRPADKDINLQHGNYGYNYGGDEVFDKLKNCPNRSPEALLNKNEQSFEPPDRAKGQVARMLFYMDVRYESVDFVSPEFMPNLELKANNVKYDSSDKEPSIGHLCTLLEWNRHHKPTEFEKRRNNRVEELQGNRNPFIDNPAWADKIWRNLAEGKGCSEPS